MRGVEASDAIALQDLGDRRLSDANCFVGRRRDLPQVEQPLRSEIAFEIEHRRKIAPELFAHAVCKAVALGAKIVGNARPLPQFNDDGIGDGKRSEATQIGAQGRGHHLGVTAVVLGTGQREAVAEAIHLLRVDGVNLEAALDQRLDHGAVRDLDCDMDLGWYAAARRRQPDRHLGETLAAVPENFLADPAAVLVRQENMMALARPIDASIPSSFINHPRSPLKRAGRRNLRRSLYWRSESGLRVRRGPHGASIAANSSGHASPPGDRVTGGDWLLPTNRLGLGRIRRLGPRRGSRCVPLRFTSRDPRRAFPKPHEKGTGVGFDISCGVRTMLTGLPASDIMNVQNALANSLFQNIPAGVGSKSAVSLDLIEMDLMLAGGARWAIERGWGERRDLERIEERNRRALPEEWRASSLSFASKGDKCEFGTDRRHDLGRSSASPYVRAHTISVRALTA